MKEILLSGMKNILFRVIFVVGNQADFFDLRETQTVLENFLSYIHMYIFFYVRTYVKF